ncbi:BamA/TamA family outer membrane protein [Hydrogenophaga sp. 5NK40-0174]|uniref:autotransporter assembly complex protein TamA n=1 Tax=Hydrogenophaga sp. 5NK40-0174 TaxID=3127649 RepID=UPI0031066122
MRPSLLSGRVAATTRLFCFLTCLLPFQAWAQAGSSSPGDSGNNTQQAVSASGSEEAGETSNKPRFDLAVQAPEDLKSILEKHLELQRFRYLEDLDGNELDRLILAAPDNVSELLGTQGYFSPTVKVSREAIPPGELGDLPPLGRVRVLVETGPITRVATPSVFFTGEIESTEAARQQRETIERRATKDAGERFTQARWDALKSDALRELTAERFPRGQIRNSLSDIDTQQQQANWYIELDSGPRVRIGDVRVQGAERYATTTAERLVRLSGLKPGADYSLTQLQDAQQKIADSGYYSSVFAYVDLDHLDKEGADPHQPAPVIVQVKESKPQKVTVGVGGSTNNGPRFSLEHNHLRFPGIGWRVHSKLQLEDNDSVLQSDWNAPIEEDGWHWLTGIKMAKQLDDETTTTSLRLNAGKSVETDDVDRRYFVQYDRSRTSNASSALASSNGFESALSANYGWIWRRFDNEPFPDRGYGLGVTLGAGSTLGSDSKPFFNTQVRWLGFWPLGDFAAEDLLAGIQSGGDRPVDTRSRDGRIALRVQAGALKADNAARIPDTLLYMTGGDNTVRGYGLRDIGVELTDGTIAPGRYMAVASAEWQRPIRSQGERTDWETVVFVDAGAVANDPVDFKPRIGTGVGVRYNSPVGPLQLDLAYGLDAKRFRVHLNVGFRF